MKCMKTALLILTLGWLPTNALVADPLDLNYQFSNFYREQNHAIAADLLKAFLTQFTTVPQNNYWPTAFFFSRIFQDDENYNKLLGFYQSATKHHKDYILDIFYLKATQQTKPFLEQIAKSETDSELAAKATLILEHSDFIYDPLVQKISHSNQLDMLWAVFLTSGDVRSVDKIAGVLGLKDLTREKFTELASQGSDMQEASELLAKFGVEFSENQIQNIDDLDIRLIDFLRQGRLSTEFKKLRVLLAVSDEEVYSMALKGSAFWSLRSNAQQHEAVLAEIQHLVTDPAVPGYTMLRILLANVSR